MTVHSNGYPEENTFATRLRQIFFELARHEEASLAYEDAAMTAGAPHRKLVNGAAPRMCPVVTPIDSARRR